MIAIIQLRSELAHTVGDRIVLQKCRPLRLICFHWHFRDLYCSRGRKAPCSLWGKAIAISWWTDTGQRTEAATQDLMHLHKASNCFTPWALMFLCVLRCTLLCFTVPGLMWAVVRSLPLCCWWMPRCTAAIQWRVSFCLSWEEVGEGQTEASGVSHCSLMSASRIPINVGGSLENPLSICYSHFTPFSLLPPLLCLCLCRCDTRIVIWCKGF